MNEITISELIKIVQPGDVLMTSGTTLLSRLIRWSQQLAGDPAKYTHIALFGLKDTINNGYIYEAYKDLNLHELKQYIGYDVCVIRNVDMNLLKFKTRLFEIENNLGQIYPYHRLFFHLIDGCANWILRNLNLKSRAKIAKMINFDRPVCSEWVAQIFNEDFEKWAGVVPDDFDDKRLQNHNRWKTIFEGKLIDEIKIPLQESTNNIQHKCVDREFQTCF